MELSNEELFNIVQRINEEFYDLIYEDEWLKYVFEATDRDVIKSQQTDFIVGALGGPRRYCGRSPKDAHPHIFIQEDMWQLREYYLIKAFDKIGAPEWLREKWLKIDMAFKAAILKNSPDECFGRYKTDPIINIPNPKNKKAA
tara:strand:+ start:56 stop:484 length:429 start_codon:yes stop_codon:yes gene_type:complete